MGCQQVGPAAAADRRHAMQWFSTATRCSGSQPPRDAVVLNQKVLHEHRCPFPFITHPYRLPLSLSPPPIVSRSAPFPLSCPYTTARSPGCGVGIDGTFGPWTHGLLYIASLWQRLPVLPQQHTGRFQAGGQA